MRNRSHILDHGDFQSDSLQSADRRFTSGAGAFDADFDFAHAMGHGLTGRILRDLLSRVRGTLAGPFETNSPCARPADQITVQISDGYLGVVEGGENVG